MKIFLPTARMKIFIIKATAAFLFIVYIISYFIFSCQESCSPIAMEQKKYFNRYISVTQNHRIVQHFLNKDNRWINMMRDIEIDKLIAVKRSLDDIDNNLDEKIKNSLIERCLTVGEIENQRFKRRAISKSNIYFLKSNEGNIIKRKYGNLNIIADKPWLKRYENMFYNKLLPNKLNKIEKREIFYNSTGNNTKNSECNSTNIYFFEKIFDSYISPDCLSLIFGFKIDPVNAICDDFFCFEYKWGTKTEFESIKTKRTTNNETIIEKYLFSTRYIKKVKKMLFKKAIESENYNFIFDAYSLKNELYNKMNTKINKVYDEIKDIILESKYDEMKFSNITEQEFLKETLEWYKSLTKGLIFFQYTPKTLLSNYKRFYKYGKSIRKEIIKICVENIDTLHANITKSEEKSFLMCCRLTASKEALEIIDNILFSTEFRPGNYTLSFCQDEVVNYNKLIYDKRKNKFSLGDKKELTYLTKFHYSIRNPNIQIIPKTDFLNDDKYNLMIFKTNGYQGSSKKCQDE